MVTAESINTVELHVGTCCAEHFRTGFPSELYSCGTDTTCCCMDEDSVILVETTPLKQAIVCSKELDRNRHRLMKGNRVRNVERMNGLGECVLGVAACPACNVTNDPLANVELFNVRSDRINDSSDLKPGYIWGRRAAGIRATTVHHISEVDPCGFDSDPKFVV